MAELERIAIDRLLGLLSADERELLRRSCLFRIPVPLAVMGHLHPQHTADPRQAEAATARLCGLGVLNRFENPLNFRVGHDHALVDPMVRPKLDPEGQP